ncbi:hypothetical protein OZX72_02990 [Bifidobacterium sp. ESL0769]|uniref:hypothetical protein n=1 Tax=Bifidobacterium sp. ESL0769 TaxID=2983229 RepID=UPI0023F8C268|nr:hypothetical protein [Bifidobacterium sp. ESL0769]WEV67963.1 hypothetical protein OZX72_02990 [Bifidobacterium sp. ESL0769]
MKKPTPELRPRYATPRNPGRETDGPIVARYAKLLGMPLIPWQRQVIDVISEIDPETGTYFYDTLVLTVQRQAGKTTITKTYDLRNSQWGPRRRIWYLAQTGKDAGDAFRELTEDFKKSRLKKLAYEPRMSNGSMMLKFHNGSIIRPGPSTNTAGHGVQGDLINVDECWSLSALDAKTLKDGFLPTTATRFKRTGVRPQIWYTSTEGDQHSEFLNDLLDNLRGHDGIPGHIDRRTAFFDFGIPAGSDPEDLDNIWEHHPGAGWLFDFDQLQDFRDQYNDDTAGWARAFGNVRDTGVPDRAISAELWENTATKPLDPSGFKGRVCFGVAVDMGATRTAIAAAFETGGGPVVQIVEVLPGTGRAPERLEELQAKYSAPIIIDHRGPSSALHDVLANKTGKWNRPLFDLLETKSGDFITAPQAFVSALEQGAVAHASDPDLDREVESATKRLSGDAWLWNRKDGGAPTVEAATIAYWGLKHMPRPIPPQVF